MPYELIKVFRKAFLVNLAPSKPKNVPLEPTIVTPLVATKYDQISFEKSLES